MSFNPSGAVEVPLSTFGSLVTEAAPSDLPEGVSPDNQDVVYLPGSVSSRPGLQAVFSRPFGNLSDPNPTVVYAKSYVTPTGSVKNLYLDSGGVLWVEDVTNSPGIYTALFSTTPGSYAKSITAFGREYIAISDGLNGQDAPLQYDGTNIDRVTQDGPGNAATIANVYLAPSNIANISSSANEVTVTTSAAHNLLPGYLAEISGVPPAALGGGISTIVINNEEAPGLATVTTVSAHGLAPGNMVTIASVPGTAVGGGIANVVRHGNIVTANTNTPHGLTPGATVTIGGVTDGTFNGSYTVQSVYSGVWFTYTDVNTDASSSGGTVTLEWPVSDTSVFEVQSSPTTTSFQIPINYADGTWSSGVVLFDSNGKFFVQNVLNTTTFQYQLAGPNTSAASGTVTPFGQVSPGQHQMQVLFVTRQGAITRPSPPVSFIANGGQYLQVSNIPIGPPNVVSRILAFTGAQGAYFFYIPVPAQVNGQLVSTATQIPDNTTTTVTLDFSDNTLFAAIGINTPGNDLANQIVLDGALGFGYYANRLITYGQRNKIQNMLNMSFDGGYLPSAPTYPTGWNNSSAGSSFLTTGHFGQGWNIVLNGDGVTHEGLLFQSFAFDAYGAPIGQTGFFYKVRVWLQTILPPGSVTFYAYIGNDVTGFRTTVAINVTNNGPSGAWYEATFANQIPPGLPTVFGIYATSTVAGNLLVDEVSVIYAQTPFLDTVLYGSYVNNPEGFDGVSGKFGPSTDTHKVMDFGIIRDNLYLLTREPSGRLHETSNNSVTEPAGWTVNEIGSNCGALSAFCLTKSQGDDDSASGGEEWMVWASASGARIFGGDQPWKISQEIQPDWQNINNAAAMTVWAVNDHVARVIYFGLPMGTATAPSLVYPMNYRELDTSYQIAMSPPVHTSFSGRLIATDNTRKWTRWNMTMNGGALMIRPGGQQLVLFGGNGLKPGSSPGKGNVYTLNPALMTDQDYGQISPYYTTYFFVHHDQEQMLQLGSHRKMLSYLMAFVSGFGNLTITALINSLSNPWPLTCTRTLSASPTFDLEWTGGSAQGQRMAFKIASSPATGTDNAFTLQKLIAALKPLTHLPVRGAAK